jgi:GT2 family glycosyltransferase
VITLNGTGGLWWAGAIDLGLRFVSKLASPDDWVLFLNNDTHIQPRFIRGLLRTASRFAPAAVGGVLRHDQAPFELLSIGPKIDARRFVVSDALFLHAGKKIESQPGIYDVDALSGRGVLYPVRALIKSGGMLPRFLPHYLADYELSLRVRSYGWRLVVDLSASIYTGLEFGNANRGNTLKDRFFSARSPSYFPALILFWWRACTLGEKLTFPFRLFFHLNRLIRRNT